MEQKENSQLTLEMLTLFLKDIAASKANKERRLIALTGKEGAISYYRHLYKELGLSEYDIDLKITGLRKTLKKGLYQLDENGCTPYGII